MLLGAWEDADVDAGAGRDHGSGRSRARDDRPGFLRPPRVFRGYALDLDGTVYLGGELLPGAADTIARIRGAGSRLVFLTNNPLRSPAELRRGA